MTERQSSFSPPTADAGAPRRWQPPPMSRRAEIIWGIVEFPFRRQWFVPLVGGVALIVISATAPYPSTEVWLLAAFSLTTAVSYFALERWDASRSTVSAVAALELAVFGVVMAALGLDVVLVVCFVAASLGLALAAAYDRWRDSRKGVT